MVSGKAAVKFTPIGYVETAFLDSRSFRSLQMSTQNDDAICALLQELRPVLSHISTLSRREL